jgi:DNA invertase Pin-like site-specific DNA recombinase
VIYCRISLDSTGEGLGVARQEEACRALCERRGWQVVDVITDNSVSATTLRKRAGWDRVLGLITAGSVDVVVAWQVDRMYRQPRDLEDLVDLAEQTKITLATVSGDLDLTTPNGRLVARIVGATARQEVEIKSERQKAAHLQRAKAGKPWWNVRPFGFERNGEHRSDEAEALRRAYLDVLAGATLYSIAASWSRDGIVSPKGGKWRSSNLRHVLMNPRNAALHTYKGEETGQPATWEAIVDEGIYRATVRLLSDPARNPGGGGRRKGLLTGVVVCSRCAGKVALGASRTNKAGERYRVYTCAKAHCITIEADFLESFVLRKIIDRADQWAGPVGDSSQATEDEVANLRVEESVLRERKRELAEIFAGGEIDRMGLSAGTEKANTRLNQITDRLAEIAGAQVGVDVADAELLWQMTDEMATDRLRSIIETVTEAITLLPRGKGARRPKADDVEITWRRPLAPRETEHKPVSTPVGSDKMWDEAERVAGVGPTVRTLP